MGLFLFSHFLDNNNNIFLLQWKRKKLCKAEHATTKLIQKCRCQGRPGTNVTISKKNISAEKVGENNWRLWLKLSFASFLKENRQFFDTENFAEKSDHYFSPGVHGWHQKWNLGSATWNFIYISRFNARQKFLSGLVEISELKTLHENRPFKGCQIVYFHTKNPTLGNFWRALEWKSLVYYLAMWNILRPFGTFYGPLVIQWPFGIFPPPRFGIMCQEKSGNPGSSWTRKKTFFVNCT
jgi:hypothetical protein